VSSAERCIRSWLLCALVATTTSFVRAQTVEPRALFPNDAPMRARSGEEIARRALDNLFGFDASIRLEIERRAAGAPSEVSEFLVERRRMSDSRRLLAVSVRPAAVRGNRVLQINYDDGREETFAYVPTMDGDPVRARYRLSEPFLATWYEVGAVEEPPAALRALAEYEVLGLEPATSASEPAYKVSLRSIVPRGYERTELIVASADFAVLEQRHYSSRSRTPVLVAVSARGDMIRFADRLVPSRIVYRDAARNAELEVRIRYAPLEPNSDARFLSNTFHRAQLDLDAR
jgi:hypothetical protein